MEDIEFLFECVEQYLADENYPEHFLCAIEDMFKEIVSSLNIEEWTELLNLKKNISVYAW